MSVQNHDCVIYMEYITGYRQSYSGSETSTDLSISSSENLSLSARQDPQGEENTQVNFISFLCKLILADNRAIIGDTRWKNKSTGKLLVFVSSLFLVIKICLILIAWPTSFGAFRQQSLNHTRSVTDSRIYEQNFTTSVLIVWRSEASSHKLLSVRDGIYI